jgi:hypothetical protein
MDIDHKLNLLKQIQEELIQRAPWIKQAIETAYNQNRWFSADMQSKAIDGIASEYLNYETLKEVSERYHLHNQNGHKKVGLILAGNIPLVGFHDLLCVFLSDHKAFIKLSSKDATLLRAIIQRLIDIDPDASDYFQIMERLSGFDAIIATGSSNSARYFESYFKTYPHIIRKNRNGVGVMTGKETKEDWINLGHDIFTYYGLGCRNVSKLYVPNGYDFTPFLETIQDEFKETILHEPYKNNFDYSFALYIMNKVKFVHNGCLIIKEDKEIASRISCVHYEQYDDLEALTTQLNHQKEQIQCVVSLKDLSGYEGECFGFGQAQQPSFFNYADGVDTMQFLLGL